MPTTVGFGYLITILLIAASGGMAESIVASVVATFCFNYFFLPPSGTLTISDPENWVALFAFLISSIIASDLSRRARRRGLEMERLYSLSRSIMLMDGGRPIGEQVARELVRICEIPAVAIYDSRSGAVYYGGSDGILGFEGRLKHAAVTGFAVQRRCDGHPFCGNPPGRSKYWQHCNSRRRLRQHGLAGTVKSRGHCSGKCQKPRNGYAIASSPPESGIQINIAGRPCSRIQDAL